MKNPCLAVVAIDLFKQELNSPVFLSVGGLGAIPKQALSEGLIEPILYRRPPLVTDEQGLQLAERDAVLSVAIFHRLICKTI